MVELYLNLEKRRVTFTGEELIQLNWLVDADIASLEVDGFDF